MKRRFKVFSFTIISTLILFGVLAKTVFTPTPGEYRTQVTCEERTALFRDCKSSLFFNADSDRCKIALVKDYQAGLYRPLNFHLRGIFPDPSCEGIKEKLLEGMRSLRTAKANKFYRGVMHFPALDELRSGDCFLDLGYMSMTVDEEVAQVFTHAEGEEVTKYIFEIETNSAKAIEGQGDHTGEQEAVILPGTPLLLTRINHEEEKFEKRYFFKEVDIIKCQNILH
jgi:hypothetical protein